MSEGDSSPSNPRRTVWLLAACYALSVTSISLTIAASPIIGSTLAPRAGLATLPVSLQVLGTMLASLPASLLMGRIGRRNGFLVGLGIGAIGATLATVAIFIGSFGLFVAGSLGLGLLNGFAQFFRFAAADVAGPTFRARAISYVMAGGVVAGVLGPGLAAGAADLVTSVRFIGSYASIIILYLMAASLLLFVHIPRPKSVDGDAPSRPLSAIVKRPAFLTAVLSAMVAYGTMALLMTATPLSMAAAHHPFATSAFVIQAHVVAMFLPSFLTGNLIHRFGRTAVMTTGLIALIAAAAMASQGQGVEHFSTSLILLGVGWNFMFVGATDLLTSLHSPSETAKVQGVNDLLVFGTAASASFLAGYLQNAIGWTALAMAVIPVLIGTGLLLAALGMSARRQGAMAAA